MITRGIVLLFFLALLAVGQVCNENCCCKVCSSPSNEAFPYGLTTVPIQGNPFDPQVRGSSCHVPTWSDRAYNDSNGNPITTVPDQLYWTNFDLFGTWTPQVAPFTCDCCKVSVHTSCFEVRPAASRPKSFSLSTGYLMQGNAISVIFSKGYELNFTDIVELRRDTFCGYPNATLRATYLTITQNSSGAQWDIPSLPTAACYSLCYFHSSLTTPTWYWMGHVTVFAAPIAVVNFVPTPNQVIVSGSSVTLNFMGLSLLSVFTDAAEVRTVASACGSNNADLKVSTWQTASKSASILTTSNPWCQPAVIPRITSQRPRRYIELQYSDCPVGTRLLQQNISWEPIMPVSTSDQTYKICFGVSGTWASAGNLFVQRRNTPLLALQALMAATGGGAGGTWIRRSGWLGGNECQFAGIQCNLNSEVTSIVLGRNLLAGTLPVQFFLGHFPALVHLALEENNITGTIPDQIGNFKKLVFLDLGFNQLSGSLPSTLINLKTLDTVYISNNALTGALPYTLSGITKQWIRNTITPAGIPSVPTACTWDEQICSERGSSENGVFVCGYVGIAEEECVARGCCFNSQAPLVFGGSVCFTKRSVTFFSHPQCTMQNCTPGVSG